MNQICIKLAWFSAENTKTHYYYCIHYPSWIKNSTDDKFMHPPSCHQSLISLPTPVKKCVLSPNQLIVWKSNFLVPLNYSPFTISSSPCIHIFEQTVPEIKEIVLPMLQRVPIFCTQNDPKWINQLHV